MSSRLVLVGIVLIAAAEFSIVSATTYPPGPAGTCLDSLTIWNVRDPAAPCHPSGAGSPGDTLWVGISGVVTGLDTKPSGVGFFMQLTNGGPWSGLEVFTANTIWPVSVGDMVEVRPSAVTEYQGQTELESLDGPWGSNLQVVALGSGYLLPPPYAGTAHELRMSLPNAEAEPWEGCLVRIEGALRVARTEGLDHNFVIVDDVTCPPGSPGPCDSVFVQSTLLPNPSLPQPGPQNPILWVQGCLHSTATRFEIAVRDSSDIGVDWTQPAWPRTWGQVKSRYSK